MFFNFGQNLLAMSCTSASGGTPKSMTSMLLPMAAIFLAMYFLMIRPQKKKQKSEQDMRESIQIGDEITTIGGIVGRVVTVKEDSLIIETGADRVKMKITRWAIQTNNSSEERVAAEKAAASAAKNAEKEAQQAALSEGKEERERPGKKRRRKKDEEE